MVMESPKYRVDVLSKEWLPWFVEVAALNMLKNELKRPELINKENLYRLACKGMFDETAFIVFVNNIPCGAIAGLLVPNLYNPKVTTLVEAFWYVKPENRNSRAGILLLKRLEERAKECADEMTLSLLPGSDVNFDGLKRRGFELEEFCFRKEF